MSMNGRVYVEGLPSPTSDEQLNGSCGKHGKIKSARVVMVLDKTTRQRRGFWLVEIESANGNHKIAAHSIAAISMEHNCEGSRSH